MKSMSFSFYSVYLLHSLSEEDEESFRLVIFRFSIIHLNAAKNIVDFIIRTRKAELQVPHSLVYRSIQSTI